MYCLHIAVVCVILLLLCRPGASFAQVTMGERATVNTRAQDSALIKDLFTEYDSVEKIDADMGMAILWKIIEIGKAKRFPRAVYIATDYLSMDLQQKGQSERSIQVLRQAIPYILERENRKYGDIILDRMGQAYANLGKYDSALHFYNISLAMQANVGKRKSPVDSADIYNHIAIVWARVGEEASSLNTFLKAKEIALRKNDSEMVGMLTGNAAQLYITTKELDKAQESLEMARQYYGPQSIHQIQLLHSLGSIADQRKQYDKALKYMYEAIDVIRQRHKAKADLDDINSLQSAIGTIYLHKKDYSKAVPILANAYHEAKMLKEANGVQILQHNLSSAYSHTGAYEAAYKLIKDYSIAKDSTYKNEKTKTLSAWLNARTAEQDKAILSQQLNIAHQQDELRKKNIWIGGSLLILLVLVSVGVPIIISYRQKQILQQSAINELKHRQEIDELKAQVRGEEQERQRIAQELHDNIASQLLSVNQIMHHIQYDDIGTDAYDSSIASVFQQLTNVTQDVRKTAHNLMPDLLLEEGLSTALASVCEKIRRTTNLEVDFQEYGIIPIIDKDIELSIYRMIQEFVQNVLKHAKDATYLLVQLSCVDTLLSITVEDNGIEFENGNGGNGLQQVQERVKALKGHFDLHHSTDKGTTVYLEFDLQHFL